MESDHDNWNEIKKSTHKANSLIGIRAGEIRWRKRCQEPLTIGNEIIGKGNTFHRPVLILKKFSGDVFLGLPLTSKEHNGDWYYKSTHKDINQTIILNQGRILDRKRLEEKIFEISEAELEDIKKAYCALIMRV